MTKSFHTCRDGVVVDAMLQNIGEERERFWASSPSEQAVYSLTPKGGDPVELRPGGSTGATPRRSSRTPKGYNAEVHIRDRRRRQLRRQRHYRRRPRPHPQEPPRLRLRPEARPLPQRRPRHDVALPARRGLRHQRRRRDRPRPRALRALHRRGPRRAPAP